jgi:hypothetical protein
MCALSTDVKVFGAEHPKIANRLRNLAWLLRRARQLTEAEPLSRHSVEILLKFQARNSQKHTSWESTLNAYVGLLSEMGYPRKRYCDATRKLWRR